MRPRRVLFVTSQGLQSTLSIAEVVLRSERLVRKLNIENREPARAGPTSSLPVFARIRSTSAPVSATQMHGLEQALLWKEGNC